jgi:4-amino-4-deoxy-L-arabinose transferase-like glycosyltransferase
LPGTALAPSLSVVLGMSALVWTFAAWFSRGNLDVAGDMVENYAWGIEWQAGYSKHPPLFAWITAAWFSVLPRTDLAYFALSALNAGVGLLGVAALARRFLSAEGAAFAALALAVSPLYTSLAIKFNANAVQLSVWPWTAYFFVVYMQTGRLRQAAACGALAALALMGKYFSAVLVLALILVAWVLPSWRQRLLGMGPWLALAAGVAVISPHILWMFDHQFSTLQFASQRMEGDRVTALLRLLNYMVAQVAYLLPSAVFLIWSLPPQRRREGSALILRAFVRPSLHRELWWLAFAPMIVIASLAAIKRIPMASVWGMAQWFAITTLWLAVLGRHDIVPRTQWLRRALPAYWVAVLALSLAVGYFDAQRGSEAAADPRAELAQAARGVWREHTGLPLKLVGGPPEEAMSIAFYGTGRTRWWSLAEPAASPWIGVEVLRREGSLLVCPAEDDDCQHHASKHVAAVPIEITLQKRAWGIDLPPRSYRLYLLMPL